MVRTKTKYRKFKDGGAVPLEVQIDTPAAHIAADAATAQLLPAAVEAMSQPDEASAAFQKQIDALRKAEQAQRQRQAAPPPLPEDPEERLAHWKRQGISDDEAEHLNNLIEYPAITAEAVRDAEKRGLLRNSAEYNQVIRDSFESRFLNRLQAPPEVNPVEEVLEKARRGVTERQESEPSYAPEPGGRSSFVSAPVSRETAANGSYNAYGDRPGRITLTVAQKEAAMIAGISQAEYAQQLLRLRDEKRDGLHGGQP